MRSLLILLLIFSSLQLHAQLNIELSMERPNYAAGEAVRATITVTNTTGQDIVLGGPAGGPWLDFVIRETGVQVTNTQNLPVSPIIAKAGQAVQRSFRLDQHYFLKDAGSFIVRANVYLSIFDRWVASRPASFNLRPLTKPRWVRTFSMPAGHPQSGQFRRYEVHTFMDLQKTWLIIRVMDEATNSPLFVNRLSQILTTRDIQPALDPGGNLHLFFLGSPTLWVYLSLTPEGRVQKQQLYKYGKGNPSLVTNPDGTIYVGGGATYDPNERPPALQFRKLSDRPLGLILPP